MKKWPGRNRHPGAKNAGVLLFAIIFSACTTVEVTGPYSPSGTPIAYSMAGTGSPTVVFESGLGNGKTVWSDVMRAVKRTNQVFAYDRPGYGLSRRVVSPREPCAIAAEERNLLRTLGLMPPYILVGHSVGGLYQYVYAKLYQQDVAGIVLVDPTHPGYLLTLCCEAGSATAIVRALLDVPVFSNGAAKGEFDQMDDCLAQIDTNTPLNIPARVLVRNRFDISKFEFGQFAAMYFRLSADWSRLAGVQVERISSGH